MFTIVNRKQSVTHTAQQDYYRRLDVRMSLQGKEGRRLVPHTKYHFTISANAGSAKDFKIFVFIHGLEEVSATYFFSQFFFCGNFPIFKIGLGRA